MKNLKYIILLLLLFISAISISMYKTKNNKNTETIDKKKLIKILNKAFADEWLAYYQYWIGSQVAKGRMQTKVIEELKEHAADELKHAQMIVSRILQLGGTPILNPKDWAKERNCKYLTPSNFNVKNILEQNIEAEQCAIKVYRILVEMTQNKDRITYSIVSEILKDEIEHEDDLKLILEDIKLIK